MTHLRQHEPAMRGSQTLSEFSAPIAYVQFIDGDCELQPQWVEKAKDFLDNNPAVAVVCGRRRERYPEASQYNRLCDMEWDTPVGPANSCGGELAGKIDRV